MRRIATPVPEVGSLVELLQWRAREQPQQLAYSFVQGDGETVELTYAELDAQARRIAAQLQQLGAPGARAILFYPPSLEYVAAFFGCLYAGIIAVPAYPPQNNRPAPRIQAIVADAQATIALSTSPIMAQMQARFVDAPDLAALHWLVTDQPDLDQPIWHPAQVQRETLAFLQYTSGSTSTPKGVMLTHANLLHNLRLIHTCFAHTSTSRGVIWLPPYHDMGLIGGVLEPLHGGFPVTLMSPVTFLQRPLRWLEAISRDRGTTSGGPNFAYELCVNKITPEQRATLDLSSWQVAFTGAEPIRAPTLRRFAEAFEPCGFRPEAFYPCYGLAEATLIVSGGISGELPKEAHFDAAALEQNKAKSVGASDDARTLVGCGTTLPDQTIAIVDPTTSVACAPGEVGEIWVNGPSIAQGYWNRPTVSAETFGATLAVPALDVPAGPYLRTGDLGFLVGPELFVTGRLKDLIIIRGRNHYPQDIEQTVERSHPALRPSCCAAFAVEIDGEERLVVVQEIERRARHGDTTDITDAIRQTVAEQHELQVHAVVLIKPATIPKTSSGKIQRHACKLGYVNGSLDVVSQDVLDSVAVEPLEAGPSAPPTRAELLQQPKNARRTALQSYLRQTIAQLLRTAPATVERVATLASLGLDSLLAIEIKNQIEIDLEVVLPLSLLLEGPSLGELTDAVLAALDTAATAINFAPLHNETNVAALSYGQRALWFLQQLAPDSAAYNIAQAVRLRGAVDPDALRSAFQALVDRHAALRTVFPAPTGEPRQLVQPTQAVDFVIEDAHAWSTAEIDQRLSTAAHTVFDLARGPLLRVLLLPRSSDEAVLLVVVHHIISDFWTLSSLLRELAVLYRAARSGTTVHLPAAEVSFGEYVQWQQTLLASPTGAELWSYWQQQLGGELPQINLPTDRPRPAVQRYRGATSYQALDPALVPELKALAERHQTTLYVTLLSAFYVLLQRYSGQDDLLVGTPTTGRSRAKLSSLMNYLVNPLVVRADLGGNPSFSALLRQVQQTVLGAFAHQEFPFALLAERLQPVRDPSRSPLFQVMFVLQQSPLAQVPNLAALAVDAADETITIDDLRIEAVAFARQTAQFDLTLAVAEVGGRLITSWQYNSDLFDAGTISRMADQFATLLQAITADPNGRIADVALLQSTERHALLTRWNATEATYPAHLSLHGLFEAQVAARPAALALLVGDQELTYAQLNDRATQLAGFLRARGVGPEVLVGVCVERSVDMLVALLGILKAGGAYVPLDPAFPAERIAYVLADAQAPILLTQAHLAPALSTAQAELVCLDRDWPVIAEASAPSVPSFTPSQLAYAIYTSGSTGRPKGVQIPHQAVVNFMHSMAAVPGLRTEDRLCSVTTLAFDIAALELFLPLTVGAAVVLAERAVVADGPQLLELLERSQATVMQATPATWRLLLEAGWNGGALRVFCGGEALPLDLAQQLVARSPEVWNLYGPTETTIWSAVSRVEATAGSVHLGLPINNTQLYVLDPAGQPVPLGVPGELHIGGDGLARGYLHRAALTAEKFVPNPFAQRAGERLYQTGDLVRYRADGTLEYLGRIDQQVKIRGFRVELGEIETALLAYPGVQEAVVTARSLARMPGVQHLVAYLVGPDAAEATSTNLRTFLKTRLPDYMLPAAVVVLAAFPRTPNGKINRRALPEPEMLRPDLAANYVAPEGELEQTIAAIWQEVLEVERVGIHDNFFDLGGHSLLLAQVHSRLRAQINSALTMVDLFQYPTIKTLAAHLRHGDQPAAVVEASRQRGLSRRTGLDQATSEIAIVGLSGRFPGAASVSEFWQNLREGVESIRFFSAQELIASGADPALVHHPQYVRATGMLDGVEYFDAAFFGYSPREAAIMDPQHRVFLETAWHALEDAGYDAERFAGRIGMFAGVGMNTYLLHADRAVIESAGRYQAFIGNDKDFVPTRVSYKLNLTGPSINVQTACSSSLVALHLASQSLRSGESDMALAGGVAIGVPQQNGYLYEAGGIPSPDGHCRAFDAQAEGTVFGSGTGVVVLKRLQDAQRDGDTIHAVIRGSALNNDGALKIGYTAPSVEGQAAVIAEALAVAQVDPITVGYVEAHGTGTTLGDPIEISALAQGFATNQHGYCALGSVKTNIGHLDTAAGMAGLIKTVMALKHAELPPSLHYSTPNPKIDFANSPFYVNTKLTAWPRRSTPRRAGVSSFGIGGTNAHVVLEEAPLPLPSAAAQPWQLLLLSAKTPAALDAQTARLREHLRAEPNLNLADVAYTLQVGRKAFNHRRIVVAQNQADAIELLAASDGQRVLDGTAETHPQPLAWMFSGQGAQYVGMGRELYDSEPIFRAALDRCAALLEPLLQLDLRTVIYPTPANAEAAAKQLQQTALTQPALFALEYALAQLWLGWGILPSALIGHSIGEYVAACLAGVFSLEDALTLVAERGRLMQRVPAGTMLALSLTEGEVLELLTPDLSLAAVNGPQQCVVAGTHAAIDSLADRLEATGVTHRRLYTSHAFHSAMMDPILADFETIVDRIKLHAPQRKVISNVSGTWLTADQATDPAYWARHLRQAVRFADGIATIMQDRGTVLLEVGPGTTLSTLARQQRGTTTVLASLRHPNDQRPDRAVLLATLGRLWLAGLACDWSTIHGGGRRQRVGLPGYPFERQRHWIDAPSRSATASSKLQATGRALLDDWLYAPLWKQSVPPLLADGRAALAEPGAWLLFSDPCGIGSALHTLLVAEGQTVVRVEPGTQFAQLAPQHFAINPTRPEDYAAVLAAVYATAPERITVLHLWSVTPPDTRPATADRLDASQEHGFYSLLLLAQACAKHHQQTSLQIAVVSNNLHKLAGEHLTYPEKATVLGPCKVIPQEYPGMTCRSIDLVLPPADSEDFALLPLQLVAEATSATSDTVVAYRGEQRWTQSFEPLALSGEARFSERLTSQGVYVITGGLGGIGLVFAEYLARTVQARLVLLGRTALPGRSEWAAWLSNQPSTDPASRAIVQIQRLEALGATVDTAAVDVADRAALGAVLNETVARYGTIHGVIHAAGVAGGGMIQIKDPAVAAKVLRPKVVGTVALYELLRPIKPHFLLLCSSINAVLGGFGQVDYAAANAFMDSFATSRTTRQGMTIMAINWDRWEEVGMAVNTAMPAGFKELQQQAQSQPISHPLLASCITRTPTQAVYRAEFSPAQHWVLSEHVILDQPMVPGTTYLEMARAALADVVPGSLAEISAVVFIAPLMVRDGEQREVLTTLDQIDHGYNFRVTSRLKGDNTAVWQEHVHGKIAPAPVLPASQVDLAEIRARCQTSALTAAQVRHNQGSFITTGPRWENLHSVQIGEHEGLAELELPSTFAADLDQYALHPALLDVATGAIRFLETGNYLPLAYERLTVRQALPRKLWSHFEYQTNAPASKETLTCNISLLDEQGTEVVMIHGFSMRRVSADVAASIKSQSAPRGTAIEASPPATNGLSGIFPSEGVQVLERLLQRNQLAQVVVSVQPLSTAIAQANDFNQSRIAEDVAQIDLPTIVHARPQISSSYQAPRNDLERQIADIWQRVLGLDRVGIHDNFFELGGTSLSGIQVIAELKKALQIDIPSVSIFEAPTVGALAVYLRPEPTTVASFQHSRDRADKKLARKRKK